MKLNDFSSADHFFYILAPLTLTALDLRSGVQTERGRKFTALVAVMYRTCRHVNTAVHSAMALAAAGK